MNKDHESLEKFIHQTLRGTAAPKAPLSLEQRVLAQLAREAHRPWWQQSFHQWPRGAQMAFLLVSAAVAAFLVVGGIELFRHGVAPSVSGWWHQVSTGGATLYQWISGHILSLSTPVLYGLIGAGVALISAFVIMLGCGAAAYRLLWKNA